MKTCDESCEGFMEGKDGTFYCNKIPFSHLDEPCRLLNDDILCDMIEEARREESNVPY